MYLILFLTITRQCEESFEKLCSVGTYLTWTVHSPPYHNMQHLSVTTERNVPIPKWLCHSLRVSSVYIVDFSILQHWVEDSVNIYGLHSMFITVLYANTTAQQFPPHFRAFPQLSSRKIPPLAVARLSSLLFLWFHKDIVVQLYIAQWYSPDNAYIILHRWFPCLFFFSF